jgi:hypothetical protein
VEQVTLLMLRRSDFVKHWFEKRNEIARSPRHTDAAALTEDVDAI